MAPARPSPTDKTSYRISIAGWQEAMRKVRDAADMLQEVRKLLEEALINDHPHVIKPEPKPDAPANR